MDLWFPTIIWRSDINTCLSDLRNHVLDIYQRDPKGNTISNDGGWQSHGYLIHDEIPSSIENIFTSIQDVIDSIDTKSGFSKLKLSHYWFNINGKGHSNHRHDHFDSKLSGVLYIDIPEKDMGDITFHRDDNAEFFITDYKDRNNITAIEANYTPQTGQLLMFPSWVKHEVKRNRSDKLRISMSFNVMPEDVVLKQRR